MVIVEARRGQVRWHCDRASVMCVCVFMCLLMHTHMFQFRNMFSGRPDTSESLATPQSFAPTQIDIHSRRTQLTYAVCVLIRRRRPPISVRFNTHNICQKSGVQSPRTAGPRNVHDDDDDGGEGGVDGASVHACTTSLTVCVCELARVRSSVKSNRSQTCARVPGHSEHTSTQISVPIERR